jgi:hypothetical protein
MPCGCASVIVEMIKLLPETISNEDAQGAVVAYRLAEKSSFDEEAGREPALCLPNMAVGSVKMVLFLLFQYKFCAFTCH